MIEGESTAEADDLHAAARQAVGRAATARDLALEIERVRVRVVNHDDAAVARHTPDTWSSQAATESRTELQRGVGLALWSASRSLGDTRAALERHADHQDELARSSRDQAEAVIDLRSATLVE